MLYGLMTEEINFSYEGGIYGELIRNRTFKANAQNPVFWNTVGNTTISLDKTQPLGAALNVSLKLDTSKASEDSPVGIANGGYWGIPVRPNTTYRASFYARGEHFSGPLAVSLQSASGERVFANAVVPQISGKWKEYDVRLITGNLAASKGNRFVISTKQPGEHGRVWFQNVSLFPPTYNNRPNGTRPDIMQWLADMQPTFSAIPRRKLSRRQHHRRTFQLEGNHRRRFATSRTPQPVGLLVHRRLRFAGVPRVVRELEHGAGAGGLCGLFFARRAR